MTHPFTDEFRIEMAREVGKLRYAGWPLRRIAEHLGVCLATVQAFEFYSDYQPPAWPPVVTRIERTGLWYVVRDGVRNDELSGFVSKSELSKLPEPVSDVHA